jgi:hypothetical protein
VTPTLSAQAKEEYPYFPGLEPTLRGDDDFLLEVSQSENFRNAASNLRLRLPLSLFVSESL